MSEDSDSKPEKPAPVARPPKSEQEPAPSELKEIAPNIVLTIHSTVDHVSGVTTSGSPSPELALVQTWRSSAGFCVKEPHLQVHRVASKTAVTPYVLLA